MDKIQKFATLFNSLDSNLKYLGAFCYQKSKQISLRQQLKRTFQKIFQKCLQRL